MIEINLIPVHLRKKGGTNSTSINIPQEVLVGVGSGLIFIMVTAHLVLGGLWLKGMGRLSSFKNHWEKVLPVKNDIDAMNKESGELKMKTKTLSDITTKKTVLWAPKFNAISDDLPRGLWLRKIILDKASLTMEGSVVSKTQNEINNVGLFVSTLKQNDTFMKDFSTLDVNSIQRGKNNAVDVTDFTVMAKLK